MPCPITPFGFAPAFGYRDNKSFSPPTPIVANVNDDFRTIAFRLGCVANLICEAHLLKKSSHSRFSNAVDKAKPKQSRYAARRLASNEKTIWRFFHLVQGAAASHAGNLVRSERAHTRGRGDCGACEV